jgi:hypothetical protein
MALDVSFQALNIRISGCDLLEVLGPAQHELFNSIAVYHPPTTSLATAAKMFGLTHVSI